MSMTIFTHPLPTSPIKGEELIALPLPLWEGIEERGTEERRIAR
jgi:hypothetical protein